VAAGGIDDEADPDLTEVNTASPGGMSPGIANYSVGVAIDTRGLSEGADIGGTITVTAETDATAPSR
jgi:type II secretory pathway pseudopilin PulG